MANEDIKQLDLIEKLNEDNYSLWKFKMSALLNANGIWQAIESEKPIDAAEAVIWSKADSKALSLINLSVSNSQIVHIKTAKSAKQAWEILKDENSKSTIAHRVRIYQQMFRTQMKLGQSMQNHLSIMMSFLDQLNEMDKPLDSDIAIGCILGSLSDEYSSIKTAIEAWSEDRITMKNVKSALLHEYNKIKESRDESQGFVTEFNASDKSHSGLICNYCHKYGHFKANCRKRKYQDAKSVYVKEENIQASSMKSEDWMANTEY